MNEFLTVMEEAVGGSRLSLMYIDPATTSYLIQIGAGVVIALGTTVAIFWSKIKRLFKKNKDEEVPKLEKNKDAKKEVVTADDLMNDGD